MCYLNKLIGLHIIKRYVYICTHILCDMKNVTLSIPDDLLAKSREYANEHGTSLNQMIRDFLKAKVMKDQRKAIQGLFELMDKVEVKTNIKWTRDELYER